MLTRLKEQFGEEVWFLKVSHADMHRAKSALLWTFVLVVLVASATVLPLLQLGVERDFGTLGMRALLLVVCTVIGTVLFLYLIPSYSKALSTMTTAKAERRLENNEPFILYLREFGRDDLGFEPTSAHPQFWVQNNIAKTLAGDTYTNKTESSLDAILVRELGWVAPVVAIGRPGSNQPTQGAFPIFTTNERWRDVVAELSSKASAIVIWPSASAGVIWEIRHMATTSALRRLIVLTLDDQGKPYDDQQLAALFEGPLQPLGSVASKLPQSTAWFAYSEAASGVMLHWQQVKPWFGNALSETAQDLVLHLARTGWPKLGVWQTLRLFPIKQPLLFYLCYLMAATLAVTIPVLFLLGAFE